MKIGGGQRAVLPVIGVVLLVAIVVVLASVVGVLAFNLNGSQQDPARRVRSLTSSWPMAPRRRSR